MWLFRNDATAGAYERVSGEDALAALAHVPDWRTLLVIALGVFSVVVLGLALDTSETSWPWRVVALSAAFTAFKCIPLEYWKTRVALLAAGYALLISTLEKLVNAEMVVRGQTFAPTLATASPSVSASNASVG